MADALASGKKPGSAQGGDDAFISGIRRLASWGQHNLRPVIVAAAGMAIVVLGVLYYVNFQESVREQAAGELAILLRDRPKGAERSCAILVFKPDQIALFRPRKDVVIAVSVDIGAEDHVQPADRRYDVLLGPKVYGRTLRSKLRCRQGPARRERARRRRQLPYRMRAG